MFLVSVSKHQSLTDVTSVLQAAQTFWLLLRSDHISFCEGNGFTWTYWDETVTLYKCGLVSPDNCL